MSNGNADSGEHGGFDSAEGKRTPDQKKTGVIHRAYEK